MILAHHADDQGETVLQRLLRGSNFSDCRNEGPTTPRGTIFPPPDARVKRTVLREVVTSRAISWREDASNASPAQQRNRVRALLAEESQLVEPLIELGEACARLTRWLRAQVPKLGEHLDRREMNQLPPPIAREAARRWLSQRGTPAGQITPAAIERLLAMAGDAATPARQHFPGGLLVRRRGGKMFVDPSRG